MSTAKTIGAPITLSRRVDPSAVAALFRMTVARLIRGRRLVVLSLLFSLPVVFALLAQHYEPRYDAAEAALILVLGLIPQTLMPLTALVYGSGMIQDEIEEQTLTYLLIRSLPRPVIYVVKLAATLFVTAAITAVFTLIAYAVVYRSAPSDVWNRLPDEALKTIVAMCLSLAAYGSLFGLISLFVKRTLVLGVAYIILFEAVLANVDFTIRKVTVMYQFRVLTVRWLALDAKDWNIVLADAPTATWAALNLTIAAVVLTVLGALLFAGKEFRVKTPEGA